MKLILRNYGIRQTTEQKQVTRSNAITATLTRGTSRKPYPPRDIICQTGPRGVLVTWNLPAGLNTDIQRWRVYKGDENTLYSEINDRGTRQCFIETTSGSTPPVTNIFVSSLNSLGVESAKIQSQGTAAVEASAPSMPNVPPGYNSGGSGGGDTGGNYKRNNTF